LDTITSLILLMLTMLPSLRLISSNETVSSNQCLCCSTGLKLSWPTRQNSKTWVQVTRRWQSS